MIKLPIKQLPHGFDIPLPQYQTAHSAGLDLHAAITDEVVIPSGTAMLIPTGIAIALPVGMEAQIRSRSGLALKHSVIVLNSPGTIDADYRGEIKVILINHGAEDFVVTRAMRIAQMVITRYVQVELSSSELFDENTARGVNGFGSTKM